MLNLLCSTGLSSALMSANTETQRLQVKLFSTFYRLVAQTWWFTASIDILNNTPLREISNTYSIFFFSVKTSI